MSQMTFNVDPLPDVLNACSFALNSIEEVDCIVLHFGYLVS